MSSREHWFDPRLTVFIIWGIFVILFVCIPSKRVVQRIFYLCGFKCCGYEEEVASTNINRGSVHEVHWEILSNARKQEIDGLRDSHLTYRLYQFSMTLGEKHMLRQIPDAESAGTTSQNDDNITSLPQDRKPDPQSISGSDDVEAGLTRGIDPPESDAEEGESKYTHVSIPQPGHNFDEVDVHNPSSCTDDSKKPKEEKKGTSKIRIFGTKSSKGEQRDAVKEEGKEDPNNTIQQEGGKSGRRSCPIFCAICLSEFETSERISWSSNPDCTHVFHEACVVHWLVSLGRTKSKHQRFSHNPSEAQLLNYEMECPCCRQEFISREHAELPEIVGEESV